MILLHQRCSFYHYHIQNSTKQLIFQDESGQTSCILPKMRFYSALSCFYDRQPIMKRQKSLTAKTKVTHFSHRHIMYYEQRSNGLAQIKQRRKHIMFCSNNSCWWIILILLFVCCGCGNCGGGCANNDCGGGCGCGNNCGGCGC